MLFHFQLFGSKATAGVRYFIFIITASKDFISNFRVSECSLSVKIMKEAQNHRNFLYTNFENRLD